MSKKMISLIYINVLLLFHIYGTDVIGNQSGLWTLDNSPYQVIGNIVVPVGESLTIEPGVQVQIMGNYRFTVQGTIQAVGTEADSIRFFAIGSRWDLMRLENENQVSNFTHCIISNADTGVSSVISPVNIINCRFDDNITGVRVYAIGAANPPQVNIVNSKIENSQQNGIFIVQNSNTLIDNCEITTSALNNQARGAIQLSNQSVGGHNSPTIINNHIHNNVWQGLTAWDITGAGNINPTVENNLIENNLTGIYLINSSGYFRYNIVRNNFVTGNPDSGAGVMINGATSMPIFMENIFTGNFTGFYIINNGSANLGDIINDYPGDDGMNHIYNNVGPNGNLNSVYSLSTADIMAQNNIWDSEDYDEIAATIHDGNDNPQYGMVIFDPIYQPAAATISGIVTYTGDIEIDEILMILYDPLSESEVDYYTLSEPGDFSISTSQIGNFYLYVYGISSVEPHIKPFGAYGGLEEPTLLELQPGEEFSGIVIEISDQSEPLHLEITGIVYENATEYFVLDISNFIFPVRERMYLYSHEDYLRVWAFVFVNDQTGEVDSLVVDNQTSTLIKVADLQIGQSWISPMLNRESGEVIYLDAIVSDQENLDYSGTEYEVFEITFSDVLTGDVIRRWRVSENLGILETILYEDSAALKDNSISQFNINSRDGFFPLSIGNSWSYSAHIPSRGPTNLRYFVINDSELRLKWEVPRQNAEDNWEGYRIYRNGVSETTVDFAFNEYYSPYPTENSLYYVTAYNNESESIPSNEIIVEVVSIGSESIEIVHGISLKAYPNPVALRNSKDSNLRFKITISQDKEIDLAVFNIRGQRVATIFKGYLLKGNYDLVWKLNNNQDKAIRSGIYFLNLRGDEEKIIKKITIID